MGDETEEKPQLQASGLGSSLYDTKGLKDLFATKPSASLADVTKKLTSVGITDYSSATGQDLIDAGLNQDEMDLLSSAKGFGVETPWYKDSGLLGAGAGLASTLMQAAALPTMLKQAKLQNKSLKFNLDTAKAEQGRRNQNISAFNAFKG